MLPAANPKMVGAEVDEGGFAEAGHSSVVEVINEDFAYDHFGENSLLLICVISVQE